MDAAWATPGYWFGKEKSLALFAAVPFGPGAGDANIASMLAEGEAIQFGAMKGLQEKGVTLHRWDPEILDALRAAWDKVATELAAEDATFAKVYASYSSYRADYAIWKDLGYLK